MHTKKLKLFSKERKTRSMISHSYPSYNRHVVDKAYKSLQNGDFSSREKTTEAEHTLSEFLKVPFTKLVASGYSAMQCALIGVGIKHYDEVIIPNITCPSVYHAIKSIGAIPKIIDVGRNNPLLTDEILKKEKKDTAVIVPNMFGIEAQISSINNSKRILIEDNAQCFSKNKSAWSDVTIHSFSPTKLMTIGYSGAVIMNEKKTFDRIQCFLDCDHTNGNYSMENIPFRIHSEMPDFQSAMLIEQLKRYEVIINYRLQLQKIYDEIINSERLNPTVPFRYQIVLQEPKSEELSKKLQERGISAVPLSSHLLHEVFTIDGDFSNSIWWKKHILSLPIHEGISLEQAKFIANEVKSLL